MLHAASRFVRKLYLRQGEGKGARHPHCLTALAMLADVTALKQSKRAIGTAVRLYRRCIALRNDVLGPAHIDSVSAVTIFFSVLIVLAAWYLHY